MTWQERIAGARMTVDQEFADRVAASQFSRQQWGLIMTAVEFEVEAADDPEAARMVADTSGLKHVLPELDEIDSSMAAMGGGAGGGGGGGGLFDSLREVLGFGTGSSDDEQAAAAEALAQEYATELQAHLESEGRWESVREAAAGG